MNKKILIGSIIAVVILILVSFNSVVGYQIVDSGVKAIPHNFQLIREKVSIEENDLLSTTGGLIDNLEVEWFGTQLLTDIFLHMLNLPVFYTHCDFSNKGDIPLNINQHIKLETKDGRILYEFDNNVPFPLNPHHGGTSFYFLRPEMQAVDYMWGHFYITHDIHIEEDNSKVKLSIHGFIFNLGAFIFKPRW